MLHLPRAIVYSRGGHSFHTQIPAVLLAFCPAFRLGHVPALEEVSTRKLTFGRKGTCSSPGDGVIGRVEGLTGGRG